MAFNVPTYQPQAPTPFEFLKYLQGQKQQERSQVAQQEHQRMQNALLQAQTSAIPERLSLAQKNALIRQGQLQQSVRRFSSPEYKTRAALSMLPKAAQAAIVARNPNAMAQIVQGNIDKARGQFVGVHGANKSGVPTPQEAHAVQQGSVVNHMRAPEVPEGLPDEIRKAAQISANQALTTAKTRGRLEAANILDKFTSNPILGRVMSNATTYAGFLGKGKLGIDAMATQQPQAYQDYLEFKNTLVPNISNQIRFMEGASISPQKGKELRGMLEKGVDSLTTNPETAFNLINRAFDEMRALGGAIREQGEPIYPGARERATRVPGRTQLPPRQSAPLSPEQIKAMSSWTEEALEQRGRQK